MKKFSVFCVLLAFVLYGCTSDTNRTFAPGKENSLRAPAYPLITIDPYTSVWSFTDQLNEDATRHWTGKKQPLLGAIRVDGVSYGFMGVSDMSLDVFLPTAATEKWNAAYTEKEPAKNWTGKDFNDASWTKGKAAFGTKDMPNLSTPWESKDIWVRRTFDLGEDFTDKSVFLEYSHDDIFELYINGIPVISTGYVWKNNVLHELPKEVVATLKPGKNVIAAHCHNQTGGAYVDFGLFEKIERGSSFANTAIQKSATVLPTQTFYTFECGSVQLDLIFTAPLLMDKLDLLTAPVNYITYQVKALDGKEHDVQIYMEATPQWAVDTDDQAVTFEKIDKNNISYLKTGTVDQKVLNKKGDDVRIDWGYFYLAAGINPNTTMAMGEYHGLKKDFIATGTVPAEVDINRLSPNMLEEMSSLAYCHNLGKVAATSVNGYVMVGYDDLYSIQYFGENLLPYWKEDGKVDIYKAFENAASDYPSLMQRCGEFDVKLMNDAEKSGGKEYAELCALAYRQSIAAHKLVKDKEGNLLFLSKENFSNGSIGTVDITYPSAPLYLIYNPDLLKGMLTPIFYYSESGKWKKPFAAHDVGTYPQANGQTYGGDMPVEETGNMIILTTAIAMAENNADYAKKHWEVLTTWADYLVKEGLDPENQLCTDDFAGHFAHNTNLSIKAIMGIAGYGKLADMLGKKDVAEKYIAIAKDMATKWQEMAKDGDHYRLTFDQPGTWSQKYNLVWDQLFGMNIFPAEIAETEAAYYQTKQNTYGLPLDSRRTYSKSDWIIWSACLIDNADYFIELISPVHKYVNETSTRMPMSDWYETPDAKSVGFRARSVVGGYYMKMLKDKMLPGNAQSMSAVKAKPAMQQSKLFVELPDCCPTPDGMAIAPNGDLILACPNYADLNQPACLMRITKDKKITKWLDVPVLAETGWAAPMGLAFSEDGKSLFVSDNQGWSGVEKAQNKGRVLRLNFDNDKLVETIEVAIGLEHPNGIRVKDGKLYLTQSSLSKIEDPSGLLVSGVYCFDVNDKNIKVNNTREDKNLITTVITKNKEVQYGLDGIVFDKDGNLYVGNFGDGAIHKITFDESGKVTSNDVWAQDLSQMRTTDGICMDDKGNIWVADFSANSVARIDKNGKITRIAQSPDCDGSNGGLDQPGEPIQWNDQIIVSCFDIVTGPDKINTKHDKPFTLAVLELE